MKLSLGFGLVCVLLAGASASAQMPPETDADFVMKASVGNMFEMEEAQVALDRATDPRLKSFARKMIADHGKAEKKLQDAADKSGAKPQSMLDKAHQAMLDNLKTMSGTDFDKGYIADQVAAHAEAALLLSDYQQHGKNSALKSWSKTTLPTVKMHQADINAM